jgi:HlyD family secretion protein
MKKKLIWTGIVIIFIGIPAAYLYHQNSGGPQTSDQTKTVEVVRGGITEKALAVGTIEPEHQIEVKSKVSGVVKRIYAQPGEYVRQGDPLIEVQPDPTPLEVAEAKRNVELTEIQVNTIRQNLQRQAQLLERGMVSNQSFEETERQFDDAMIRLQMNRERLELLESGRVSIGGIEIESVVKAPISGYILERMVDIGDPVVPLTSYQAGTAMMRIADMSTLIFKGSVDEIDVGKLFEGMQVELKIGALPGAIILGELSRISLRATKQDNATVFPVEIRILDTRGQILRAGYSANADIIIKRLEDILIIPERLISFRDNMAYVNVLVDETAGTTEEKQIEVGSSNAISIEVTQGLSAGEKLMEPPSRSLSL